MTRRTPTVVPISDDEWHWLYRGNEVELFKWTASSRIWSMGRWLIFYTPQQAAKEGWSYLEPIITPAAPGPKQATLEFSENAGNG